MRGLANRFDNQVERVSISKVQACQVLCVGDDGVAVNYANEFSGTACFDDASVAAHLFEVAAGLDDAGDIHDVGSPLGGHHCPTPNMAGPTVLVKTQHDIQTDEATNGQTQTAQAQAETKMIPKQPRLVRGRELGLSG